MSVLQRKKTEEKNVWDIEHDGEVVGIAKAHYKTPTQRWWNAEVTINETTVSVEGIFSIKQAMEQLEAKLVESAALTIDTNNEAANEAANEAEAA